MDKEDENLIYGLITVIIIVGFCCWCTICYIFPCWNFLKGSDANNVDDDVENNNSVSSESTNITINTNNNSSTLNTEPIIYDQVNNNTISENTSDDTTSTNEKKTELNNNYTRIEYPQNPQSVIYKQNM